MLRELLTIFRAGNPMEELGKNFNKMMGIALDNTLAAGEVYFGKTISADERSTIYELDVKVNQLERTIRKQVAAHLAIRGNHLDVPYCLLMMSLVKDVERLGDYAKNLAEARDMEGTNLPEDEFMAELQAIRVEVETIFKASSEIFQDSQRERALESIQSWQATNRRCDVLITRLGTTDYTPPQVVALVLGIRYYKRLGSHLTNILSGVIMPLHKVDYFDEDEVTRV